MATKCSGVVMITASEYLIKIYNIFVPFSMTFFLFIILLLKNTYTAKIRQVQVLQFKILSKIKGFCHLKLLFKFLEVQKNRFLLIENKLLICTVAFRCTDL